MRSNKELQKVLLDNFDEYFTICLCDYLFDLQEIDLITEIEGSSISWIIKDYMNKYCPSNIFF